MTDTLKIQALHTDAKAAAEKWHKDFREVPYSTPFYIDGQWVRVTIETDNTRNSISMRDLRERLDRVLIAP